MFNLNRLFAHTAMASLVALGGMSVGCNGYSPPSPSAPSPAVSPLSVTGVSPETGSTGGSTSIRITGTGFQPGATVAIDGTTRQARFDVRTPNTIYLLTPAHDAETVELVVTNPDGQSGRLSGGYTYVSPEAFDFNGTWSGFIFDGSDREVRFTIQDRRLVGFSCDTSERTVSPQPPVSNGEFSFAGADGVAISGRIVSASEATGTIALTSCADAWRASKLQ